MDFSEIKSPKDILKFMKTNIKYGWFDYKNEKHIGNMVGFRLQYRTASLNEVLEYKIGSCIEQTYLIKYLLDSIGISSRMFCIRAYEDDYNITNFDVFMHCFILYSLNDKIYHIENCCMSGIYEFNSYEEAINSISKQFILVSNGLWSTVTEFFNVPYGMSFKELNRYMNDLDIEREKGNAKVRKRIV